MVSLHRPEDREESIPRIRQLTGSEALVGLVSRGLGVLVIQEFRPLLPVDLTEGEVGCIPLYGLTVSQTFGL
jgi:hypothetical protein